MPYSSGKRIPVDILIERAIFINECLYLFLRRILGKNAQWCRGESRQYKGRQQNDDHFDENHFSHFSLSFRINYYGLYNVSFYSIIKMHK